MRLIIAEKPSFARAIAQEICPKKRLITRIECSNDTIVTWCFEHLLEQAEPDKYTSSDAPKTKAGKKKWRFEDLPIFPEKWILEPRPDKGVKEQLAFIGKMIRQAKDVVNAGDPDREGQLLVDEVLEYHGCQKPVLRFWANALDSKSVRKALDNMQSNSQYLGIKNSALGRQRADWLLGMNLS